MSTQDHIHQLIVEASLDGLWVVDARGRTIFANARVAKMLGRTEAEIATLAVGDVLAEPDRARYQESLQAPGHESAAVVDCERVYLRPDGSTVPLLVTERPLRDSRGEVVGHLHRLADDSRRRALLEEVRRSQSQLAEAQSIAGIGSWEICDEPREVTWSRAMYDVLGVDPDTFVAGPDEFIGTIVEADRARGIETWESIGKQGGELATDVRIRRGDGTVRWVRVVGQTLEYADDGRPLRFGGTVQDIHEVKQAELTLLDSVEVNALMQFLATAANEAHTFDEALVSTRHLLLAHPDWQRGAAFKPDSGGALVWHPVGADAQEPTEAERAVAARAAAERIAVFEEKAQPDNPMIGFPVLVHEDVVVVLVITACSPFERHQMLRSLVGQVSGQLAQVAVRDRAASELADARDGAMAASQAKSDFLAMMSHEIRTPLNGVIGLNDLLLHTSLDSRQRELAEAMQGAGRALLVLISDILDFSKIEAGSLELEAVEFQPSVVVEGVRDLFAADALSRGIALDVKIDPAVPRTVEGDPSRFGQILSNLVSNAVKFTHEGRVQVDVSADADGDTVTLRVQVADTGIGLNTEQRGRIFQPFRQADVSTTRTFGGTGLGLAIAHRLAGALGGEIGVDSEPGVGSTFWFTSCFRVPVQRSRPVVAPRAAETVTTGGHVLVVEDNEVNQLVTVGMLEVLGYTCEVAADGAAGAARATAGQFDAVLMDLQMPRLDGFGATRLIRQAEPPGVGVPIIALTASATAGEEERCRAAGMTGFLSKPVRLDALRIVLADQLAGQPAEAPETHAEAPVEAPDLRAEAPVVETGVPVLDPGRLEELAEMGSAAAPLIQRAIDNFVGSAPANLVELQGFWRDRDGGALRQAAHKLKGSAANLGAERVAAVALVLEHLAEDGAFDAVGPRLVELAAEVDEAVIALSGYEIPLAEQTSRSA